MHFIAIAINCNVPLDPTRRVCGGETCDTETSLLLMSPGSSSQFMDSQVKEKLLIDYKLQEYGTVVDGRDGGGTNVTVMAGLCRSRYSVTSGSSKLDDSEYDRTHC